MSWIFKAENRVKSVVLRTVGIDVNLGSVGQQQFHDFKRSGFCTIVESCVALDGFPVHISLGIDQKSRDFEVTFVASDHQASVTMTISNFNIWKKGTSKWFFEKVVVCRLNFLFFSLTNLIWPELFWEKSAFDVICQKPYFSIFV